MLKYYIGFDLEAEQISNFVTEKSGQFGNKKLLQTF